MPAGALLPYAGRNVQDGWLLCDGSAVSRTTYADLFTAIGTTYGTGDGSTTFTLPDMRGRTAIGAGQGPSLSNRPLGATGIGEEMHTLSTAEMPAHSHGLTTYSSLRGYAAGEAYSDHWKNTTSGNTASAGSGNSHNNMQPSLPLNYIIKY
jgi:microcystin-dependent protein